MVNPPEIKNVSTKSSICGLRLPEKSNLWIKYGYENGDFIMTCNKKSSIHIIKITKTIIVIFSVPHPSIKNVLLYFLWLSLICYNVNFPFCLLFPDGSFFCLSSFVPMCRRTFTFSAVFTGVFGCMGGADLESPAYI